MQCLSIERLGVRSTTTRWIALALLGKNVQLSRLGTEIRLWPAVLSRLEFDVVVQVCVFESQFENLCS